MTTALVSDFTNPLNDFTCHSCDSFTTQLRDVVTGCTTKNSVKFELVIQSMKNSPAGESNSSKIGPRCINLA
ncbi:hypothetical protein OUZ56_009473 [Daphnia magna]|uniref:Uncharacterized protein n=1 Tax=Daphnia magna TaxID=35525 RepID=A0ABR0AG92_9CRUS|nr:hypothetical protein OUZ56_009473 [Daphnia magna]